MFISDEFCFIVFRLNRVIGVKIVFNTASLRLLNLHFFGFGESMGKRFYEAFA